MDCFVKAVPIGVSKIPERIKRLEGHAGAYANVLFCSLYLHLAGMYLPHPFGKGGLRGILFPSQTYEWRVPEENRFERGHGRAYRYNQNQMKQKTGCPARN
jgi:hypothetical protein